VQNTETSWLKVAVLIGAGAAVALQIGKVPAALPALQVELGLSLVQSGWVVSIFSIIAAGLAVFLGIVSDRFGHASVAVFGMLLTAAAGIAGGFASGGNALLITRVFEGLGFILTAISVPPLIIFVAAEKHRKTSLALWGMYLPLGSSLMLAFSGPLLFYFDWRILWWVTASLILVISIPVYFVGSRLSSSTIEQTLRPGFAEIIKLAGRRDPVLLSVIFAFYSALFLIVTGFLPLILIELNGFSLFAAASVSAVVVFCNLLGNAFSGWLHNHRFQFFWLILIGSFGMAIGGTIVFTQEVAGFWRVVAAAGFCGFAGLVPSSLFTQLPRYSPRQSVMATISGMLVQGSAVGQLAGPTIAAGIVAWYGDWSAVIPIMILGVTIMSACIVILSRNV